MFLGLPCGPPSRPPMRFHMLRHQPTVTVGSDAFFPCCLPSSRGDGTIVLDTGQELHIAWISTAHQCSRDGRRRFVGVGLWANGRGSFGSTVDTCASHEMAEAACSLLHYLLSALLALFPLCCNVHMALETEKTISPYANDKLFYQNLSGGYLTREFFWRDHYTWLQEQGYLLRPRYHPDWKPSWAGTKKNPRNCEDGQLPHVCSLCL